MVTLYAMAALFTASALATTMGPDSIVWATALVFVLVVATEVRALADWRSRRSKVFLEPR